MKYYPIIKNSIVLISLFASYVIFAQNEIGPSSYEVQLIPESPDVADLGKFGDFPVNKYNGTANVNVPIHQIDFDGLSIPFSLSYNTSGIKVNQDASWVGLGWSLSDGITITREINGFDDIRNSFLNTGGNQDAQGVGWIYSQEFIVNGGPSNNYEFEFSTDDLLFLNNEYTANRPHDTEPDLFKVNLPSGSFKFYLPKIQNNEQTLIGSVIDNKNFKVFFNVSDHTFEVIDPKGFTYSFDAKEFSSGFSSWDAPTAAEEIYALRGIPSWSTNQTKRLNSAWKVSKITSYTGRELNFTYQDAFFMSFPNYTEKYTLWIFGDHRNQNPMGKVTDITSPTSMSASINAFHNLYLTNISGDFGSIEFNLSDRTDLFSKEAKDRFAGETIGRWDPVIQPNTYTAKKLENIVVKNKDNDIVKSAEFQYSYFNNDKIDDTYKERYLRLKLDNVSVQGQTYDFEYYEQDSLPAKDTKSTDFWGFYNGVANSIRIPSYNRFFLSLPDNGNSNQTEIFEDYYKVNGAIRKSDINYGKYGILTKVTYPTGGFTEYEYEGNKVSLKRPSYDSVFFDNGNFGSSGVNASEKYNFRYQQLKLANDPSYSFVDYNECSISSNNVTSNQEFEITDTSFCNNQSYNIKVNATLSCSVGCGQGINPVGPAVWVENTETNQRFNVFYYDNQFGNNNTVQLEKVMTLPMGNYVFKYSAWSINTPFLVVANASASAVIWNDTSINSDVFEEFEVGGARIHQIINKDADGVFVNAKRFEYNHVLDNGSVGSSGMLMDDLVFASKGIGFHEYTPENFSDDSQNAVSLNSSNLIRGNPSASGSHIGYSNVIERQVDMSNNDNGSIVTKYINKPNEYKTRFIGVTPQLLACSSCPGGTNIYETFNLSNYTYFNVSYGDTYILGMTPTMYDYINGNVLEEEVLDSFGGSKSKVINTYQEYSFGSMPFSYVPVMLYTGNVFSLTNPYEQFTGSDLKNNTMFRIKSSENTQYYLGGALVNTTNYFYENSQHYMTTKMVTTDSDGNIRTSKVYYPQDLITEPFMNDLQVQNRLSSQIKFESYKGNTANPQESLLYTQFMNYDDTHSPNGLILPSEVEVSKGNTGSLEERQFYEKYDKYGNILQYSKAEGVHISYIWGYNKQYPIAKVENATFSDVANALGISETVLMSFDENDMNDLNTLRVNLPNAMISTYEYQPLVGVTSMTDPRGYTMTYHYDEFNRLKFVKDADGNLVSENQYNYKN
ncbi:RHS repeat protein [Aquimarina sp. Aq107]|uniref:RHS repeat protein n=1 Tax=Aquimarina sp. Aq107 TaxID=1191912 RepID=UPI000D561E3D|nr:RHS repeat domain-containing protein [Aquimarina sp. Aq107]